MFNSFPYDEWSDSVTDFWTWGGHGSTGTIILTVLGCILMVAAFIGFVWLEKQKLERQATSLRAAGAFEQQPPAPITGTGA